MTVSDLLQCAKPLIFENEDEDFSYSLHGTAFLARFGMRYFGITAQHCLRTRTRESVRLELDHNRGEFLPLKQVHLVESNIEHDWDFSDLAFFEVESKLVSTVHLLSNHFLDIGYFINLPLTLRPAAVLALRGYPSELNWVDYDNRVIHTQAFAVDGRYGGLCEMRHCSVIQFDDLEKVDDLDGLSGAPIFQFEQLQGGLGYLFAGVLIRGTKQSGAGRFIHASVVFKALEMLSKHEKPVQPR